MSLRRMSSSTEITEASEVAFRSELMELPSGGIINRNACGSVTRRNVTQGDRLSAQAASRCPADTAMKPLRTISAR
ncbi:hypothetical protein V1280_002721 [Bradyrhizobium sp. AZCC 2230]